MKAVLSKSSRPEKKWMIDFLDQQGNHIKRVHFGASAYQDLTQHKSQVRKQRYLTRHKNDPTAYDTPGELSRTILWSATSLEQGIANYEKKHGINIQRNL